MNASSDLLPLRAIDLEAEGGIDSDDVTPWSLDDAPLASWQAEASTNGGGPHIDPASFAARVTATRVDLVARIRDGIPPIDYLPGAEGRYIRGKRHHLPAPKKSGKSLTTLIDCACIVQAGGRVIILDRENGANLYASRLEEIIEALDLDTGLLAEKLHYYEFPRLRKTDGDELAAMCAGADLVVFDSQRMYLTDLELTENGADDYATFVGIAIDPLFRAGIATLILDNTGHEETGRGRGSAAKGDLNEVLFKMEVVDRFDLAKTGRVKLEIKDSRFGNAGTWEMKIGGGYFEPWQSTGDPIDWKPTILMERVSAYLKAENAPRSRTRIVKNVTGKGTKLYVAINALLDGKYVSENGELLIEHVRDYTAPESES